MSELIELKPTLSPTALSNYELCGRRGQYYQAKIIETPTTPGLALGGAWHKAMETFGLARMHYKDSLVKLIPQDMLIDNLYQIATGHFAEEAAQDDFVWGEGESVGEVHERLFRMLTVWANDPTFQWMVEDHHPIAIEQEVVVEMGSENHVMRGFIDEVLDTPVGIIGVDHKTAGRAWAHQKDGHGKGDGDPRKLIQAPLYAEAWERATGQPMDGFAFDVMTYAGKFERVFVDVSAEKRKPFIDRWNNVSDMITLFAEAGMEMPVNPSNNLCSPKWCGYWEICPMGSSLDRKES